MLKCLARWFVRKLWRHCDYPKVLKESSQYGNLDLDAMYADWCELYFRADFPPVPSEEFHRIDKFFPPVEDSWEMPTCEGADAEG